MLGVLLCLNRISCPNTGNHWELDLSLLSPPIKHSHMCKVPLNFPFSRLNNPSSLTPSHMIPAPFPNHLCGPLLDLLQYVHVSPVTRNPPIGTDLRCGWSPLPKGQLMVYGHLGIHQDPKGLSGVSPSLYQCSCPGLALAISLGWTSWGSCHIPSASAWQPNSGASATPPNFVSPASVQTQQNNQPGSLTMRLNSSGPSTNPWATSSDCPLHEYGSIPNIQAVFSPLQHPCAKGRINIYHSPLDHHPCRRVPQFIWN